MVLRVRHLVKQLRPVPPKKGTQRWTPTPVAWEGARLTEGGKRLLVVYVTGDAQPADRADVRWDQGRLTVTLSRMRAADGGKLAAVHHCVAIPLSQDASARILIDGATGERAGAKQSRYLDPEVLSGSERTLDSMFEPQAELQPQEVTA